MSIKVLFFGVTADIVGHRQLSIESKAPDVATLIEEIIANHPRLASHKLLFSINQQYATGHESVGDGDEVAVFTAVSGG